MFLSFKDFYGLEDGVVEVDSSNFLIHYYIYD